jgi:hypothetical protein
MWLHICVTISLIIFIQSINVSNGVSVSKKCDSTATSVDDETIAECLQPMLNYANELQSSNSGGPMQFPVQGGEIFERLCLLYRNFKVKSYIIYK